jgi:hypothetical protein
MAGLAFASTHPVSLNLAPQQSVPSTQSKQAAARGFLAESHTAGLIAPTIAGLAMIAAAFQLRSSNKRRVVRHCKADNTTDAPQNFFEVVANVSRRAGLTAAALSSIPAVANAEQTALDTSKCLECNAKGTTGCLMCNGTGQWRLIGNDNDQRMSMVNQYEECPQCNGLGMLVCAKCFGTGLGAKRLRGFFRDPAFANVAKKLKTKRVDVNTVDKLQADVRDALALIEERESKQKADQGLA